MALFLYFTYTNTWKVTLFFLPVCIITFVIRFLHGYSLSMEQTSSHGL